MNNESNHRRLRPLRINRRPRLRVTKTSGSVEGKYPDYQCIITNEHAADFLPIIKEWVKTGPVAVGFEQSAGTNPKKWLVPYVPGQPPVGLELDSIDPQIVGKICQILVEAPLLVFDAAVTLPVLQQATGTWPPLYSCITTKARLIENRAYPEGQESKPGYEDNQILERWDKTYVNHATNPILRLHTVDLILGRELGEARLHQVYGLERDLMPVTHAMMTAGIGVDVGALEKVELEYSEKAEDLARQIRETFNLPHLNLEANEDLIQAFKGMGIDTMETNAETLAEINHPAADLIVRWRQHRQVGRDARACLGAVNNGRIHPEWEPLGTGTGRYSCKNPPLQSLSGNPDFRRCFIPASGYRYIRCDYAQADIRPLAFLCGDSRMREIFRTNQDFHRATVAALLDKDLDAVTDEERSISKCLIFGITYGMKAPRLAREARFKYGLFWTIEEAEHNIAKFLDIYPGLRDWREKILREAETAFECRTIGYQRRRLLPPGNENHHFRYRRMLNMPGQGTVADALKEAMVAIHRKLPATGFIIANYHDELLLEVREENAAVIAVMVQEEMEKALGRVIAPIPAKAKARICRSLADK